jgi:hypothetical protein
MEVLDRNSEGRVLLSRHGSPVDVSAIANANDQDGESGPASFLYPAGRGVLARASTLPLKHDPITTHGHLVQDFGEPFPRLAGWYPIVIHSDTLRSGRLIDRVLVDARDAHLGPCHERPSRHGITHLLGARNQTGSVTHGLGLFVTYVTGRNAQ